VLAVAAKIANAVRLPFVVAGAQLAVTTSVGIARFHGGGQNLEELLANADRALYGAKRNGRDGGNPCGASNTYSPRSFYIPPGGATTVLRS
jgi:diguanylate cyclase (GGDEF)-like protein